MGPGQASEKDSLRNRREICFQQISAELLSPQQQQFRIRDSFAEDPKWIGFMLPSLRTLGGRIGRLSDKLARLDTVLRELPEEVKKFGDRRALTNPLLTVPQGTVRPAIATGNSGLLFGKSYQGLA